jgi:hypothetical protein
VHTIGQVASPAPHDLTIGFDPTSASELAPFIEAAANEPFSAARMHTVALRCLECGYDDLWRHYKEVAFALPHVTPFDLYLRGQAKIRSGDWSGWVDREARLSNPGEPDYRPRAVQQMRWSKGAWNGVEELAGQTLFVLADGGLGDCIQMLRYVPVLAAKAGETILAVRPRAVPFAQHNLGQLATVVIRDVPYRFEFQRYVWLMSLPALIGGIPRFIPFSAPGPRDYPSERPNIAICWAGSSNYPGNRDDRYRSISLEDLAPVLTRDDVCWHSVQIGPWASQATAYPSILQPTIPLHNLAQTANVLSGMDAVITVDTAVAHLAGSLGIPTLLILSRLADFRWEFGDTTPWYPSMQLIRQAVPGDWSGVVSTVMAKLTSRCWVGLRVDAARASMRSH